MNIKEAVEYLVEQGVRREKARDAKVLTIQNQRRKSFIVYNDEIREYDAMPAEEDVVLLALDDVSIYLNACNELMPEFKPRLYVSEESVAIVDHTENRECARFVLKYTDAFNLLQTFHRRNVAQDEFIRMLKIDLRGSCEEATTLLPIVRKLRWKSVSAGQSVVQHGSESLGSSVERELSGFDGAFPEYLTVATPLLSISPYAEMPERFSVSLDIITSEQRFMLTSFSDELQAAKGRLIDRITADLRDDLGSDVPVIRGLNIAAGE